MPAQTNAEVRSSMGRWNIPLATADGTRGVPATLGTRIWTVPVLAAIAILGLWQSVARCGSESRVGDSPMVKLLKSKRMPEDRQGTIVDLIGKRGTADDLAFIYEQSDRAGRAFRRRCG